MKQKLFTLLFAMVASVSNLLAYDFQYGDLYYNILADKTNEVEVTYINYYMYALNPENYEITSANIPASVTYNGITYRVTRIGEHAFQEDTYLTTVNIPNSVTSIGNEAFCRCRSLTSITIPNSITSIGISAFSYCSGLTSITIPNSVTSIGDRAFDGCSGLTSITIPNSVTSIGESAFSGCSDLTSITVDFGNPNYCDIDGILFNKAQTTLIRFPAKRATTVYSIPNSVTSIGNEAFYGCSGLTSIIIPNSVTSIGKDAFRGCSGLTSITIPNSVTSIGESAFYFCSGLTSIIIPNSVTSIGDRAFFDCTSLTSITIPNSVTSIGNDAFYNVLNIVYYGTATGSPWGAQYVNGYADGNLVYSDESKTTIVLCSKFAKGEFIIPNGVTTVGFGAFSGCADLTSVIIPNSVTSIENYAFSNCAGLTSVTIGNSVTSIGDNAFRECFGLTSITIPNSVTSIGSNAFSGCSGLTSVTIPNSVTSIGDYAFRNCTGLTSVTIPNSVISIGTSAFYNVLNIIYSGTATGSPWGAKVVNGYVDGYLVYSDEAKTNLLGCSVLIEGDITIPNSVTSIGDNAFRECSGLTSVTIPNSITSIGHDAFFGCSGLKRVDISDLAAWCNITFDDSDAFDHTSNNPLRYAHHLYLNGVEITDLVIPNTITSIGDIAFSGCSGLTSVTIPNSVTTIGNYAFSGCSGLTSVTIPNSVTTIGNYAFSDCSGLTSVTIPNSVTIIGNGAFRYCYGLTTVTIPNSVTSIGYDAFYRCSGLTSVTIPNSVTSIGNEAFYYCRSLKTICSMPLLPPTISSYTFSHISSDAIVYVPNDVVNSYKKATYWKDMNIQPVMNSRSEASSTSVLISIINMIWEVNNSHTVSIGIEGGEQQPGNVLEYIGLEPESEYKDVPIVLTSNTGETETVNVSFTTNALELTTKPSKPVSSTTAILLAETNMSDAEVSCGFEYKRNDAPADMDGTKVFCPVASGQMAGRLKNLKDDVYYKYRAFYQSAAGNMYYGDWQYIFTGDVAVEFDPILYTYGATVVKENEATISGYALAGSEDFTEQGFEYWAETRANNGANAPHRMPAALGEHFFVQASGIALRATLTNLDAGTIYRYRVYGKVGDQYYYGSEQTFTTTGTYTPPTYMITFVNWDGTELQSSQVEEGTLPEYTGATPERPEDEQYTYSFNGWTPTIVIASADATYTATYTATPKSQGIDGVQSNHVQCTKVIRNGQILILRGDKTYTTDGRLVR